MRPGYVTLDGFSDGRVRRVPSASVNAIKERFPGVFIAPPPKIPTSQMVNLARQTAGPMLGMSPVVSQGLTDPQNIAAAATLPMGGEGMLPMLARMGVGAATAGLSAGAEGKNVAGNVALAAAPEPVAKAAGAAAKGTSEMLMKTSMGRAAVGSVQKALKYGLAPTQRFIEGVAAKIGALKNQAIEAANQLEAAGHTATYEQLVGPVKKASARYAAHDVTGSETENALNQVLSEMRNKIGPKVTTTPASTIVGASGEPLRAASTTVTPAQPITPTQLQEINQIAGQKLKDLFAAKQARLGVPPDPRELGYMKVWSRSKQLLEGMGGDVGKSIGQANKEMQNLYKMDVLARKAGERAHAFTGIEKAAAGSGVIGGALTHNPVAAGASIPLMLALHAATSPEGMAAMANGLHSPLGQALIQGAPRFGAIGAGQFFNQ